MQEFRCERDNLIAVKEDLKAINDILTNTYNQVDVLAASMDDATYWDGQSHMVAVAFLELTKKYHNLLTENGLKPVKQACEDLEKYLALDEVFYDEWVEYQEILGV